MRDVVTVLQRAEMVRRIAKEIEGYVVELGVDGRLVELQLEELTGGVGDDRRLVCKDYFIESSDWVLEQVTDRLGELTDEDLLDLRTWRAVPAPGRHGSRLLAATAWLPLAQQDPAAPRRDRRERRRRFGQLPKIMRASISDLVGVEGVGEARARRSRTACRVSRRHPSSTDTRTFGSHPTLRPRPSLRDLGALVRVWQ